MRTCIFALLALSGIQAGQIVSLGPVTGAATGTQISLNTQFINNDNVGGASPNTFAFALNLLSIGVIDHPLLAIATSGVTEYDVTVQVTNNSSVAIVGWQFQLPGSPYDFDFPDFDSITSASNGWTKTTHTAGLLVFQGAPLLPGGTVLLRLPVDFPEPGGASFQSTPFAAVPEPASIALVAVPLALVLVRKRYVR